MHCGRDHGSTGARPSQLGRMTKIAPICNLLVHDKIRTRTAHFLSEPALYQRDIEKIVNAILDEMVEALRRGDRVELRGFEAFSVKLRGPRQGRNHRTA